MVQSPSGESPERGSRSARWLATLALGAVLALSFAIPAFAGQASSGELLFYPCTTCHPVRLVPGTETPTRRLPNGFTEHAIELEGHDKLGKGEDGPCMACHDDPTRDPGKLKAADGSLVDIKGDVALVCYRCHSAKYKEWKAGSHGKRQPSCVAAGCHNPHTPQYMYASGLAPFSGTGFQFKAVADREPFTPFAAPSPDPATVIPFWFYGMVVVGLVGAGTLAGLLVLGGLKR